MDKSNIANLSYDTMFEFVVKNMGEFAGHTKSCCNLVSNNASIMRAMKDRVERDQKLSDEQKECITLQIDEAISMLEDSQSSLFSNIDCLKGQLESYREVYKTFKDAGIASGDISTKFNFVEKALAPKNE